MTTSSIIFDLCGPIITIDIHRIDRNLQSMGVRSAEPYMDLHRAGITKLYDSGLITSEEFCQKVRRQLDCDVADNDLLRFWNDVIVDCPPTRLGIIAKAHCHYRTFLLSNCDVENARAFAAHLDQVAGRPFASEAFDELCFSSRLKNRKPNPEVFEYILEKHHLVAEETLFIDDCRKHCESAARLGIRTHWLQPNEDLTQLFDQDGRLL